MKFQAMKKILMFCAAVFFFSASKANETLVDSIPADTKDISSPEAIIAALYDVISGPAGQKRNWDRMRTLFVPDARMIPTGKRPTGESTRRVLTVEEYIANSGPFLEKEGFFVTYLKPQANGRLDKDTFIASLRDDTILVSVMQVNNELGVIQDIAMLADITASRGILFHVDAAQGVGKLPLDVTKIPVDLISVNAHKVYGPKGIGALYLRKKPRVRVAAQMHGGGQEQGMRSGTLPLHQIVGMGEALQLAALAMPTEISKMQSLREHFLRSIQPIKNIVFHTDITCSVPHILNLRFNHTPAETVLQQMPHIAISTASACQGKSKEASYVLRAIGLSELEAKSGLRISFGRFTTEEDLTQATNALLSCRLG